MLEHTIQNEADRKAREKIALEANEQISGLCHMVLAELNLMHPEGASGLVACIVRMMELSSATMSALGDEVHQFEDLHKKVRGYLPEPA